MCNCLNNIKHSINSEYCRRVGCDWFDLSPPILAASEPDRHTGLQIQTFANASLIISKCNSNKNRMCHLCLKASPA